MTTRTIASRRVLLADGSVEDTTVTVEDGRIAGIGQACRGEEWNVGDAWLLPGIVDLHGDAFERQMMPRPGVHFPTDLALLDTDAQLIANGVSTAYHGVTYSWEPGLRGRESTCALKAALAEMKPRLACDTRFHLRHETHNLAAEGEVIDWLADGSVDLLAFNDHTDMILDRILTKGKSTATYTARTGLSHDEFIALLHRVADGKPAVPASVERLAAAAVAHDVALASHDDHTPEMRRRFHAMGCRIAEFPMNTATAEAAVALGDPVICGAPNVVRGGSHLGPDGILAAREIREGRCTILVSDYYYPALAQAPFRLARDGDAAFPQAWALVSGNPARAAGLDDRGTIAEGARADLAVVQDPGVGPVRVTATLVEGAAVYRSAAA
ncbi:alpha-D-ribose 1-methylphosphonate 5-triphosphate diphosphatase [Thalassobaculum fulvum]|uniref:Alpha-D-ribose 1-methylphosphonate 5-triphosphate diphosphatase n=1 Tax=Thalassobaculum fulvum TaxID=1633335 RepID=A0A918XT45_9PROT|nr:alpha-D-ribose 1-methylphosphonate 5-triphosphate diphosphatase [Thalassobaculum fulvum]GHD53793.1 alpha-D-ribose 1-methylphosphonate 5-triphosphate diphosphatase [Thalassobaculum fulvum]